MIVSANFAWINNPWLAIACGAVCGAWLRYAITLWTSTWLTELVLGTLLVNLVGGFLVGVVSQVLAVITDFNPLVRAALVTGFLGSLTTFSAFSIEVVMLYERGKLTSALVWMGTHVIGALAMTLLGLWMTRLWLHD